MSKKDENLQMWAKNVVSDKTHTELLNCILSRVRSAHSALSKYGDVDDDHWNDLWERSLTWLHEAMLIGDAMFAPKIIPEDTGRDNDQLCREAMRKEFEESMNKVSGQ